MTYDTNTDTAILLLMVARQKLPIVPGPALWLRLLPLWPTLWITTQKIPQTAANWICQQTMFWYHFLLSSTHCQASTVFSNMGGQQIRLRYTAIRFLSNDVH